MVLCPTLTLLKELKMLCQRCESTRVLSVNAKCSDLCSVRFWGGKEQDGYVPSGFGIGGGDYVEFSYCADCGQIQGVFPPAKLKTKRVFQTLGV